MDDYGNTMLHLCAQSEDYEMCELIIKRDPRTLWDTDYNEDIAFQHVVWSGNVRLTKLFLKKDRDIVWSSNDYGEIAINTTLRRRYKNNVEVFKLLLSTSGYLWSTKLKEPYLTALNDYKKKVKEMTAIFPLSFIQI